MKQLGSKNLTLSYSEKEKRSFLWPCVLFIRFIEARARPNPLNILKYLSTFGQVFDLEQVI